MKPNLLPLCLSLCISLSTAAESVPVHCNLHALTKAERARDRELVIGLHGALKERKELADGYAYRFNPSAMKDVGEWLPIVVKCCQPLTFDLSFEPQPGGALWVRITGHDAKEFIDLEFASLMENAAAAK